MSTHPKYRADIDGLRAIAVLSVVGFHAFPSWFRGGFIGVDMFFVISGFLISTIIFGNLARDSFSFSEFYARRIKRIFPALLLVLFSCFALGWFLLLADEYKELGKHIVGGAGFVSNFVLWAEKGYFDKAADTKPLLHLWSLGIEEQFYIVWPLLAWFSWKKRWNLLSIAAGVGGVSFLLNVCSIHSHATEVFYSPATRIWELMAGSALAAYSITRTRQPDGRNPRSALGALCICCGLVLINKESVFPGWWAILPVAGTALILSAGEQAWINQKMLSHRFLTWFGLISYPLYLWHWPLLSFARILESGTPSRETRISLVLISVGLAALTYRFIERPFRLGAPKQAKTVSLAIAMAAVGCLGLIFFKSDGLQFRHVVSVNSVLTSGDEGHNSGISVRECGVSEEDRKALVSCERDPRGAPRYVLLGDSKAGVLYDGLIRTSTDKGRWIFIGGGAPLLTQNPYYRRFQKSTHIAIQSIQQTKSIDIVVIAAATRELFRLKNDYSIDDLPASPAYPEVLEALKNTIDQFIAAGKRVVFVVDNPTFPDPRDCLDRGTGIDLINPFLPKKNDPRCHLQVSHYLELSKQYRDLLSELERTYPGKVRTFNMLKYLCDLDKGKCELTKDGHLMYGQTDHISNYAAGVIGHDLNAFLAL